MNKKIIVLAVAVMPLAFFSCSKESIESNSSNKNIENAGTTNNLNIGPGIIYLDPLKVGLQGRFEFNGNLKDAAGKLVDAVPTVFGATVYATDRKGVANNAIQFNGGYGVDILSVPWQTKMSIAAWVKYSSSTVFPASYFTSPGFGGAGPAFAQLGNQFSGVISTPATTSVSSGPLDNNWHHLVATFDGTFLNFYVDGNFVGSSLNKSPLGYGLTKYNIGHKSGSSFWQGSMDDLRFYSRVLTAADAQKLYAL